MAQPSSLLHRLLTRLDTNGKRVQPRLRDFLQQGRLVKLPNHILRIFIPCGFD